jgi:cyclic-di-AMP phosphodiesterase PgpH
MKLFKKNNPVSFARGREKLKRDLFHQPLNLPKVNLYSTQKWALIIFLSVILGLILFSRMPSRTYRYTLGQVVPQDIKAPQDFLVEDQPSTLEKRKSAAESVRAVYDFDPDILSEIEGEVDDVFVSLKELDLSAEKKITKEEFEQLMGISLSNSSFAVLEKRKFDAKIVDYVYTILSPIFEQKIVGNRELLLSEKDRGIVVRDFSTREETNLQDFSQILDINQTRIKVQKEARLLIAPSARSLEKPVVEIVQGLIKPNLTFNKIETEERKIAAAAAVKPVLFEIKKGEMIIREGEKVNPEHLLKLNQLTQLKTDRNPILYSGGNFLILFLILSVIFRFFVPEKSANPPQWGHDLSFMSAMLILITIMIRIGASLPQPESLFLSENSLWFAVPVAAGAIVISVVKGVKQAAIFSVLISIFATMVLGNKIDYFFYPLLGSFIGAREAVYCRQRSTLLKAGFAVGVANLLVVLCLKIKLGSFFDWQPLIGDLIIGFSSGILSGIIAAGVVPLIEVMFSYTTDIKLLELGNLNHPLLKELVMEAPGTYHHSILTGSLVEAAAESIGANPLLAKVGAYYHDIGKMKKPLYFIENQRGSENKHDKLSPNMSSLILISHIKEGVEQAKDHRLGKGITDIIQQHHGTNLIAFFYQKAKEKENSAEATVDENDFRYPGPKPQTKEAGLVMLADAVEASSRTLNDPTPARIQGMVQKTINNFFTDGQLDECELTLKDIHLIAKSFNRILTGIFHHRVEYPDKIFPAPFYPKKHETLDQESPKETKDKPKNGQEDRERDLKRLGIS